PLFCRQGEPTQWQVDLVLSPPGAVKDRHDDELVTIHIDLVDNNIRHPVTTHSRVSSSRPARPIRGKVPRRSIPSRMCAMTAHAMRTSSLAIQSKMSSRSPRASEAKQTLMRRDG